MKTIFDKIDPKYIECTTGTCEHVTHTSNAVLFTALLVISVYMLSTLITIRTNNN